jgi:hypothetical protein
MKKKKITGLEIAEMLGMEDAYQLSVINEGYNSDNTPIVGSIEDIE